MIPITLIEQCKFELLRNCNHGCMYCYNVIRADDPSFLENGLQEENRAKFLFNVDYILDQLYQNNIYSVTYTGGEPSLLGDSLFRAIEKAVARKIKCSLNSNLTAFSQGQMEQLAQSGLNSMLVSCPSSSPDHYNRVTKTAGFERFRDNMRLLRKSGMLCTANMVVMQVNKDDVYATGKWLHEEFGIRNFAATPVAPGNEEQRRMALSPEEVIKTLDELLRLREELKITVSILRPLPFCMFPQGNKYNRFFKSCSAANTDLYITIDGDVSFCGSLPTKIGNLFKDGLRKCIETMSKEYDGAKFLPEGCRKCPEALVCRGGCRAEASLKGGVLNAPNPYCRGPLKEKRIKTDRLRLYNFLELNPLLDPNTRVSPVEDGFAVTAFGKELVLDAPETNLLSLISQQLAHDGVALPALVRRFNLEAPKVNKFLNKLVEHGIVKVNLEVYHGRN